MVGPISRLTAFYSTVAKAHPGTTNFNSKDAIKELHASLIRSQLHTDPSSMSDVVRSYALSPTTLHKARFAFNLIEQPTLIVWNHMIRGLSQSDRPVEAISLFDGMRGQGFYGNNLSVIFVLKSCARVQDIVCGRKVHDHALKLGFEPYLYVCNVLVYMYATCGDLNCARKVFDEMLEKDLVSWNSLICGYSQCGRYMDVISLFDSMRAADVKVDAITMVKVLLACSHLGDNRIMDSMVEYIDNNHVALDVYLGNTMIDMYGRRGLVGLAQEVFDRMPEKNLVTWNTMIMGYAKVGNLAAARELFCEMPCRDAISWTSMITAYSQANQFSAVVRLFQGMIKAKVKPDKFTLTSVLSASAHLGMLDIGKTVHEYIHRHNIAADNYLGNSLIDMYCKCGLVKTAMEVFHEMKDKDFVSWTSMISGLAVNGIAEHALELFNQMLSEGIRPSHGSFVAVLLACAHAGLVNKGLELFESMEKIYGLVPEMKHYGCVVDLLSRSGQLDKAYGFMQQMPVDPDVVVWRTLLSACKLHGNVVIAEIVAKRLLEIDPSNSGNYVLSSITYAGADKWYDAMKMREMMMEGEVWKPSGWSSIELNSVMSRKAEEASSLIR